MIQPGQIHTQENNILIKRLVCVKSFAMLLNFIIVYHNTSDTITANSLAFNYFFKHKIIIFRHAC